MAPTKKAQRRSARREAWARFTVAGNPAFVKHRAVIDALTAVMHEQMGTCSEPWTLADTIEDALLEGLIDAEKEYLGTRSMDPHARDEHMPETTPMMLALVRLAAGGVEAKD